MRTAPCWIVLAACGSSSSASRPIAPGPVPASAPAAAAPAAGAPPSGATPLVSAHDRAVIDGVAGAGDGTNADAQDLVNHAVMAHVGLLRACYEKALALQPALAGKVIATFTIGADGAVTDASADGVDPGLDACLVQQLRAIQFPKPGWGAVKVSYPFVFGA